MTMILERPTELLNFSDLLLVDKPDKIEKERPLELSLEPVAELKKKEYKKKLEESIEFAIDLDLDIYGPGLKVGNSPTHDDIITDLDPVYIAPDNWGPEDWANYHDKCADIKCGKSLYHIGSYYQGVKVHEPDGFSLYKLFCVECWKERTIDGHKNKKNKTNPKDEDRRQTRSNQKTNPKNEKRRQAITASIQNKLRLEYEEIFK